MSVAPAPLPPAPEAVDPLVPKQKSTRSPTSRHASRPSSALKETPYYAPNYKCLTSQELNTLRNLRVPVPENEAERIFALRETHLLDTDASDPVFDRFTALCSRLFGIPAISLSLMDVHRNWFKSIVGPLPPEDDRNDAFCAYTILQVCCVLCVVFRVLCAVNGPVRSCF